MNARSFAVSSACWIAVWEPVTCGILESLKWCRAISGSTTVGVTGMMAWVLMPNHVHVLAEMWKPLGVVLNQWKSYTAKEANKSLDAVGDSFWQADYFDRYIRDRDHYRRVVRYIENNPVKAGLAKTPEDWLWSSARCRGLYASEELPRIPKE